MSSAQVFTQCGRPYLPSGAPITYWRRLALHVAGPGGVDGSVNSENDRLISTNERFIFIKAAFLSQKRL
jgi:hypothetical protein